MKSLTLKLFLCIFAFSCLSHAQVSERFNLGGGAGVTFPTGRAGQTLNTGFNINLSGGYNFNSFLALDLDYTYQHSRINDATLARFGEPDGSVGTWSLTLNPVVHVAPKEAKFRPYVTSGYGLYHRNLTLTRPATVQELVCDPFFGFCFPATVGVNQVVASNDTYKAGFNTGGGFDIALGDRRMKVFVEARYHRMFTNHGSDFTMVPVTFGVHW